MRVRKFEVIISDDDANFAVASYGKRIWKFSKKENGMLFTECEDSSTQTKICMYVIYGKPVMADLYVVNKDGSIATRFKQRDILDAGEFKEVVDAVYEALIHCCEGANPKLNIVDKLKRELAHKRSELLGKY